MSCLLRPLGSRVIIASLAASLASGCMVTPDPLTDESVAQRTQASLASTYAAQQPVTRPIDLAEAMARAVRYNLDHRVQMLEQALRSREVVAAGLEGLPALAARASATGRDQPDASSSSSLTTGRTSLETSTSQDRDIATRDLALSWNVLDFGLSYVRAQTAADRVLAAEEERRRVAARLVAEVRGAYWRALAAEYVGSELKRLDKRIATALELSARLVEQRQTSLVAALTFQRDLYDIKERIQVVEQEVSTARSELATLMNLPPGAAFKLVRPKPEPAAQGLPANLRDSVAVALRERPEIRQALYNERITSRDATDKLLQLLPGISFDIGANYTSNSYTFANDWLSWSSRLSWNLIKLATYPARQAQNEAAQDLAAARVDAQVAAVALQVHTSRIRYELAQRRAETLRQHDEVQKRLLHQLRASAASDQSGDNDLVREELNSLLSRARHDVAVAEAQTAFAGALMAMGTDLVPQASDDGLASLAAAFRDVRPARSKPEHRT